MTVTKLDTLYWQVTHKGRWWTIARIPSVPASWNIQNEAGKRIDPAGKLGQTLIQAVLDHEGVPAITDAVVNGDRL